MKLHIVNPPASVRIGGHIMTEKKRIANLMLIACIIFACALAIVGTLWVCNLLGLPSGCIRRL